MSHILQVGVGSGGMPVLDLVCRDPQVTRVTLIEPDVYKPHNVARHFFPPSAVGRLKIDLAAEWVRERRPDLVVETLPCDLMDPLTQGAIDEAAQSCAVGMCAVDNEPAKLHWDALMRRHRKPWTLGEVLSGGIGGFVHWFRPGGPCYGCVASHLKRSVVIEKPSTPDYSNPGGPVAETTIPASKASIHAIASLHALVTLGLLADPENYHPGFTSLLLPLQRVQDVFEEPFRPFRMNIARVPHCLFCGAAQQLPADLDAAVEEALTRLGHE
jgi:molybdopterin/thiamine biosynthesis adenylyltransferase